MSASTLREAAALMRERAEVATPGRWGVFGMTVLASTDGTSNVDTAVEVAQTLTRDAHGYYRTWDADHIATFGKPAVALAVAHWLDATARELNALGDPDLSAHPKDGRRTAALAVATAYLGEQP